MSTTIPTSPGGSINVGDSAELAALPIAGLPIGTTVWNEDVGSFFKLTQSDRTVIVAETDDGYDDPTWTFANATFTGFEGCTLVVVPQAPNVAFAGAYVIDTVGSATEVDVVDPPSGATSGEFFGSVILYNDALADDSVVSADGTIGVRWVVESVVIPAGSVTNAELADMAAHTFKARKSNSTGSPEDASATEATALLDTATVSLKGLMSAADKTLSTGLVGLLSAAVVAPTQDLTISSGLAGDADGGYMIEGTLVTTNAAPTYSLQINGVAVGHSNGTYTDWAGTVAGTAIGAFLYVATNFDANGSFVTFRIRIGSKHGILQPFDCLAFSGRSDYARSYSFATAGQFTPSAEITSIGIHSSAGSTIDVGSYMRIRKLGMTE